MDKKLYEHKTVIISDGQWTKKIYEVVKSSVGQQTSGGQKKGFHKKDSLRELDRGHQIDARGGNLHSFATGPE